MNANELFTLVRERKIKSVVVNNVNKYKLFVSTDGVLCYFKDYSRTKGYPFPLEFCDFITKIVYNVPITEEGTRRKEWKIIEKYRKYAEKSDNIVFGNHCKAIIPKTYHEWEMGGFKSLCEMSGLTTGASNEGKVITLDGVAKQYPDIARMTRDAIKNHKNYSSCRVRFRGYDMSINIVSNEDGTVEGSLSMEYLGCGNGYYYILINENDFIGYDID